MRFSGLVAATAALIGLAEAQSTTSIISGDGPPAPSLTRTAAVGSWTPKASSDGLTKPSLDGQGRTIYINSASDFCLLMPPDPTKENLVDAEAIAVSYCINPTNGTRPMPDGFIKTAHFRRTPDYVQISGTYDPAIMNLGTNDCGGEYDSEGAEGIGNPVGVTMKNGSYFTQSWEPATSLEALSSVCVCALVTITAKTSTISWAASGINLETTTNPKHSPTVTPTPISPSESTTAATHSTRV